MFEKYTEASRSAVFFARHEATTAGHNQISPEHLLLGMLHDEGTRLEQLFQLRQHEPRIRQQFYEFHPQREPLPGNQDLPLTNQCMYVLAHAAEEACLLCDKCIDAEHLLLGILRIPDLTATHCLNDLGLTIEHARRVVRSNPVPERIRREPITPKYTGPKESKWNLWGLVLLVLFAITVVLLAWRLR
ncbi:MAG: ATPase domain protein [Acidobacteriaceae bacterium]|nr:ATPase domain protein [Acidobacteriaceae bacterium]